MSPDFGRKAGGESDHEHELVDVLPEFGGLGGVDAAVRCSICDIAILATLTEDASGEPLVVYTVHIPSLDEIRVFTAQVGGDVLVLEATTSPAEVRSWLSQN